MKDRFLFFLTLGVLSLPVFSQTKMSQQQCLSTTNNCWSNFNNSSLCFSQCQGKDSICIDGKFYSKSTSLDFINSRCSPSGSTTPPAVNPAPPVVNRPFPVIAPTTGPSTVNNGSLSPIPVAGLDHPCGGPLSENNRALKLVPTRNGGMRVSGNYSYNTNIGPKYVIPVLDGSEEPVVRSANLKTNQSAISAVRHILMFGEVERDPSITATDRLTIYPNQQASTSGSADFGVIRVHGFFNESNSPTIYGAAHDQKDKPAGNGLGNLLYDTRQCAHYYNKNPGDIKKFSLELCGRININPTYSALDNKRKVSALSATLINLALMTAYGPVSGIRIFIPYQEIELNLVNQLNWGLGDRLKAICQKNGAHDFVSDSGANWGAKGQTSYESFFTSHSNLNFRNTDCMITTSDLFDLVKDSSVFPVNDQGYGTVAEKVTKPILNLINQCTGGSLPSYPTNGGELENPPFVPTPNPAPPVSSKPRNEQECRSQNSSNCWSSYGSGTCVPECLGETSICIQGQLKAKSVHFLEGSSSFNYCMNKYSQVGGKTYMRGN